MLASALHAASSASSLSTICDIDHNKHRKQRRVEIIVAIDVRSRRAAEEQEEDNGDHTIKVAASWRVGIGGKTWSAGALASKHLAAHAERYASLGANSASWSWARAAAGLFAAKCLEARGSRTCRTTSSF